MTAPIVHRPSGQPDEFHGPSEVRAALVGNVTEETLAVYDRELDEAARESRDAGGVGPLLKMLDYWWVAAQLAAGVVPGNFQPVSPAEAVASWEAKYGCAWLYDRV